MTRPLPRRLHRRLTSALTATATVAATVTAMGTFGSGTASAGPCSEMFGNFGSLLEHRTGAGMATGSLGSLGSSGGSGSIGSVSGSLGSEDRSGSLVQQLETGSLGNGISGSLDLMVGSVYGMPPWITGEEGTVPVLRGPTQFLQLVTGPTSPTESINKYGVAGTDLGIMWDNGATGDNRQVLMAFGDTMGDCTVPGNQWRSNVLFRSGDADLSDGITVDSAAMDTDGLAKSIVPRTGLPGEVTIIPTAGISVNGVQYLRFMSVAHWGQPGSWTTNYSGMAYSTDNGENWTVVPELARPITNAVPLDDGAPAADSSWRTAQMSSFLKTNDYLYEYLTPSGRQGHAILARAALDGSPTADELDASDTALLSGVLDPQGYEYWDGSRWSADIADASKVLPSPASELSTMWNEHLGKFTAMYSQGYNSVVMRTADRPEGPWSPPTVLIDYSVLPGVYGAFMHPWAQEDDLYYLVTTWNAYNVFLVRTRLSEVFPSPNLRRAAPQGATTEVIRQVPVTELVNGVVPTE
ncbi:DUF4185 domain-containing protein [Dietzia sp. ANT_WB102]|uniref:DUF4185 domain-containing protein n=1 Tax=Dietzia sp. ANT_WB102 TaxID=2597345 RepID=UPI0011EE728E|nr:DUF4185 domain-containing protein [Dietzia sp. ANT_WB102]KAA0917345.1 DUF4185 domain-containing protein [Dietzia sp. ANT_WB102]